jgi:hypothetical protein
MMISTITIMAVTAMAKTNMLAVYQTGGRH